ncbi:MAG: DUF1194 domain-containing protein [Paracoccaceae bacterium]|nr:DUF1194 domain-containing protein [Paracoccaceae bacterium]
MRLLAILALLLSAPLAAEEVDVELALMVDVSRSMMPRELDIQRRGYAEALRSDEVISAIEGGLIGKIAVTYVEWAGYGANRVIVDWTVIGSRAEAEAVADRLLVETSPSMRRTSISGAINFAREAIRENGYEGLRRVIDISGDGPNNAGPIVTAPRDLAIAEGLVINGLPLMTRDGMGRAWHLDDLDVYYRACVIGGPGAFVIPVLDWSEFALAVRRKLVLEIVDGGGWTGFEPIEAEYDCLIGEKLWEEFRRIWLDP